MSEFLIEKEGKIEEYDEFRGQLSELKEHNESVIFDYESPKGNKDARSHVFKLRKTKTAIDKMRKRLKAKSLEYGRKVDSEAKDILSQVEEMIAIHDEPIKLIEKREADRVLKHKESILVLNQYLSHDFTGETSETIIIYISSLSQVEPDESLEEFTAEAIKIYKEAKSKAEAALKYRITFEKEKEELERLKKEQEQAEQKERERRIAEQAKESAKIESARIKKEAEEKIQKAERDAKLAAEREREKIQQEAEQAEREEKQRERDKGHRASINNAAMDAMIAGGISKKAAKDVVILIAKKLIPNVAIRY